MEYTRRVRVLDGVFFLKKMRSFGKNESAHRRASHSPSPRARTARSPPPLPDVRRPDSSEPLPRDLVRDVDAVFERLDDSVVEIQAAMKFKPAFKC